MRKGYLLALWLLLPGVFSCRKAEIVETDPQILNASITGDPATTTAIDQAAGTITIAPFTYQTGRLRSKFSVITFQTTPNSIVAPVDMRTIDLLYSPEGKSQAITIDVINYNNSDPIRLFARLKGQTKQKEYKLLLQADGALRFESGGTTVDTIRINLKYYQDYVVFLPVSNLYDGHPGGFKIFATKEGSTTPIELQLNTDDRSQDEVGFYFNKQTTPPGIYSIELLKGDGQRAIAPTRIWVDNT
ncbi:hypothetical protein WBJ53_13035 [Spirosoma sp. SC4-14]|uniref:hypothetical protein n=1 Tax=Spirosoma sp. SC4-14 TaxID=3128900 RepID=UPI0030D1CC8E